MPKEAIYCGVCPLVSFIHSVQMTVNVKTYEERDISSNVFVVFGVVIFYTVLCFDNGYHLIILAK